MTRSRTFWLRISQKLWQMPSSRTIRLPVRLPYLRLWCGTTSKRQSQGHAHFDCENIVNDDRACATIAISIASNICCRVISWKSLTFAVISIFVKEFTVKYNGRNDSECPPQICLDSHGHRRGVALISFLPPDEILRFTNEILRSNEMNELWINHFCFTLVKYDGHYLQSDNLALAYVSCVRRWHSGKNEGNYSTSRGVKTRRVLARIMAGICLANAVFVSLTFVSQ